MTDVMRVLLEREFDRQERQDGVAFSARNPLLKPGVECGYQGRVVIQSRPGLSSLRISSARLAVSLRCRLCVPKTPSELLT